MYVKLQGEFQENKLSRETPSIAARKQCRSQPASQPAQTPGLMNLSLFMTRISKHQGLWKQGKGQWDSRGISKSRFERRNHEWT